MNPPLSSFFCEMMAEGGAIVDDTTMTKTTTNSL